MVIRASTASMVIEIWRRYDEAVQRVDRHTPTQEWKVRIRQQLERDRALREASRRILTESRDLKRKIRATLDHLGR